MFEISATTSPATESRHGNNSVRDTDEQFVTATGTTKKSSRCKSYIYIYTYKDINNIDITFYCTNSLPFLTMPFNSYLKIR